MLAWVLHTGTNPLLTQHIHMVNLIGQSYKIIWQYDCLDVYQSYSDRQPLTEPTLPASKSGKWIIPNFNTYLPLSQYTKYSGRSTSVTSTSIWGQLETPWGSYQSQRYAKAANIKRQCTWWKSCQHFAPRGNTITKVDFLAPPIQKPQGICQV